MSACEKKTVNFFIKISYLFKYFKIKTKSVGRSISCHYWTYLQDKVTMQIKPLNTSIENLSKLKELLAIASKTTEIEYMLKTIQ